MEGPVMNTIKQEFAEPHLADVQRWWIRKPATITLSTVLVVVIIGACLVVAVVEAYSELRECAGYAKQCWKGRRD